MRARRRLLAVCALTACALAACAGPVTPPASFPPPTTPPLSPPPSDGPWQVYAAGDIAGCDSQGDEATAALLDQLLPPAGGAVLALGDLAYEDGTAAEFANCYDPTWGRQKPRTLPTPGNHEYHTAGAAPYFAYFGAVAGSPDASFTAWDLGSWLVLSLNSNCDEVGGCGTDAPQTLFAAESAASAAQFDPPKCVLAMWHHPRWSSGREHGSSTRIQALWRTLAAGGADIVLSGHDHEYERFVPMNGDGGPAAGGLTQFVVGTGGRSLHQFGDILPTSAAHDNSTFGVLHLTLRLGGYDWEFVPTTAGGFTDAGSASC